MQLGKTLMTLGGTALVCAGAAAGAPLVATAALIVTVGSLAGMRVAEAKPVHFDQQALEDTTLELKKRAANTMVFGHIDWSIEKRLDPAIAISDLPNDFVKVKPIFESTETGRYRSIKNDMGGQQQCRFICGEKAARIDYTRDWIIDNLPSNRRFPKECLPGWNDAAQGKAYFGVGQSFSDFSEECLRVIATRG